MNANLTVLNIKMSSFEQMWNTCETLPREFIKQVARRIPLWKYIVKQGNFYKMSLLLSYCDGNIPVRFSEIVNEHIVNCVAGNACVYTQTRYEEKVPMSLEEFMKWSAQVFG